MSHDGQLCASNSRLIGDENCVPNQKSTPPMDHKGFYVTKFLRQGVDPSITIDAQIDNPTYGRSVNWCPTDYRRGDNTEVDFNEWSFTNDNAYLVGQVSGTRISSFGLSNGVWAVHTTSNTWTQLTPATTSTVYKDPAAFISSVGVREPRGVNRQGIAAVDVAAVVGSGSVTLPAGIRSCALYDLSGQRVFVHTRSNAVAEETVRVPDALAERSLVARFER
jgi:hypothetical protein